MRILPERRIYRPGNRKFASGRKKGGGKGGRRRDGRRREVERYGVGRRREKEGRSKGRKKERRREVGRWKVNLLGGRQKEGTSRNEKEKEGKTSRKENRYIEEVIKAGRMK